MKGFEPTHEVTGVREIDEVLARLSVTVAMKVFDGCNLDRGAHPFDLAIGPRVVELDQAMLDTICLAGHVEAKELRI